MRLRLATLFVCLQAMEVQQIKTSYAESVLSRVSWLPLSIWFQYTSNKIKTSYAESVLSRVSCLPLSICIIKYY